MKVVFVELRELNLICVVLECEDKRGGENMKEMEKNKNKTCPLERKSRL
jgi:hypothetical protein